MALAAYPIQNYDVLVGGETPHHWHKGLVFGTFCVQKNRHFRMNVLVVGSMRMILKFWGGCVSFCFFSVNCEGCIYIYIYSIFLDGLKPQATF